VDRGHLGDPAAEALLRAAADGLCLLAALGLRLVTRRSAAELGLELDQAVVVGDKTTDVEFAHRLGVTAFLVTTGHGAATLLGKDVLADFVAEGLDA
jgi:phosphoglycolate phosphatase-like HAD superfamily hydrolase